MNNPRALRVVAEAENLAVLVYKATSGFPAAERYGLVSQMRRAAVSVGSNICEGSLRGTDRDFLHFLHTAIGSGGELQFQTGLARRLGYLDEPAFEALAAAIERVKKMITRLIQALRRSVLKGAVAGSR